MKLSQIEESDHDRLLYQLAEQVVLCDFDLLTEQDLVNLEALNEAGFGGAMANLGRSALNTGKGAIGTVGNGVNAVANSSTPWAELVQQLGLPTILRGLKKYGKKFANTLNQAVASQGSHGHGHGGHSRAFAHGRSAAQPTGQTGQPTQSATKAPAAQKPVETPQQRIKDAYKTLRAALKALPPVEQLQAIHIIKRLLDRMRKMAGAGPSPAATPQAVGPAPAPQPASSAPAPQATSVP